MIWICFGSQMCPTAVLENTKTLDIYTDNKTTVENQTKRSWVYVIVPADKK